MSIASSAVFRRFFLPPTTSRNKKGFAGHPTLRPISRPFRILESKSPKNLRKYVEPVETSFHKFSILCSRHEHDSSGPPKPESSHSGVPNRDRSDDTIPTIFGKRWDVPWGAGTILLVVLLWVAAFYFTGCWMIPYAANIADFINWKSVRGEALYSLVTQVIDGVAAIAILRLCLSRYRPLPPDWFRFSIKGKWKLDVMLGCLMFPLTKQLPELKFWPSRPEPATLLAGIVKSLRARDSVAMALYVIVNSICAPVWEEIAFRGFILPSLTKYMPVWCAILVSSAAFALAHFRLRKILSHVFLSFIMGVTFNRSRNLLPPVLLHTLWNTYIILWITMK